MVDSGQFSAEMTSRTNPTYPSLFPSHRRRSFAKRTGKTSNHAMFAFSLPVAIGTCGHTRLSVKKSHQKVITYVSAPVRQVSRAKADGEADGGETVSTSEWDAAVESGSAVRAELKRLSDERTEQAERTQQRLEEMSEQLSSLMAKLRAEAGMPPIADPPEQEVESEEARPDATSSAMASTSSSASGDDANASSDEPYMDPSNFGYESTAGWQVLAESLQLPENEENIEFRIECDNSGCSIIEVKGDVAAAPGVRKKFIQTGSGYRVGFDPEAPKSCSAMVGNEQWAIQLSSEEMRHFKRMCLALGKRMDRIASGEEESPAKEAVISRSADGLYNIRVSRAGLDCSVELESKLVWVQAIGQPVKGQYCVRAIFMESRHCEAFWVPDCISNMFLSLKKLRIE